MKIQGFLSRFSDSLDKLLRLADGLLVAAAGLLAYLLYPADWPLPPNYRIALLIAALLTLLIFPSLQVYRSWRGGGMIEEARRIATGALMVMVGLAFIAFATKYSEQYSRIWLFVWAGTSWVLLIAFRLALRKLLRSLRRHHFNRRRVLIVGADEPGRNVSEHLRREDWTGLEVIGFLEDHEVAPGAGLPPVLGRIDAVAQVSRDHQVDEVWIALPLRYETRVTQVLSDLRGSTVSIRFVPDLLSMRLLNSAITEIGGMPVFDICTSRMDDGVNRALKFLEDRVLASVILVLVTPLMVAIALAIKIDSRGPVLFRQVRHGWGGRTIEVYKFRSMRVNNESAGRVTQATRDDPRITRVGRWLRRSSLDELPQFINVLQGRMSIVGPRPHAVEHNEHYKDLVGSYMLRHKVKPGITGWAQVNGWRGETDSLEKMEQRVKFDLFYIENWSLSFDLRIIVLTLFKGFGGQNAY